MARTSISNTFVYYNRAESIGIMHNTMMLIILLENRTEVHQALLREFSLQAEFFKEKLQVQVDLFKVFIFKIKIEKMEYLHSLFATFKIHQRDKTFFCQYAFHVNVSTNLLIRTPSLPPSLPPSSNIYICLLISQFAQSVYRMSMKHETSNLISRSNTTSASLSFRETKNINS